MLYKKGGYWVDTDMICIRKLPFKENDILFTSEPSSNYKKKIPTSSLIKAPKNNKIILEGIKLLYELKKEILNGKITWGVGPHTIKKIIENNKLEGKILDWKQTCSCYWGDYKSLFYPNNFSNNVIKNINDIPESMYCIHLWNEMLRQGEIDKNGSYDKNSLYEQLKRKHNIN